MTILILRSISLNRIELPELPDFLWHTSANQNYIGTKIFKSVGIDPGNLTGRTTCEDENQSVQYLDGLDRLVQTVFVMGSPAKNDLIQPFTYDAFGPLEMLGFACLAYFFSKCNSLMSGNNKYLYNGKELQEELGLYDYWTRFGMLNNHI